MRTALRVEWRRLVRMPVFWCATVIVAILAYLLIPFNASIHETMEMEDLVTAQQYMNIFRADSMNLATSGFGIAQIICLLLGMRLALLDYRRTAQREIAGPPPDPTLAIPAKALTAAVVGVLLAGIDLAVIMVAGGPSRQQLWDRYGFGYVSDPQWWHDSQARLAVILGVLSFPLWACLGVGLGALVGRWRALVPLAGASLLSTCLFGGAAGLHDPFRAALGTALVPPGLLPPSTTLTLMTGTDYPPHHLYPVPVAICATIGAALYTGLVLYAGRFAVRRAIARPTGAVVAPGHR